MPKLIDLTGQRFGRLVVLGRYGITGSKKSRKVTWKCICDCGNTSIVTTSDLRTGNTRSCGCLHSEQAFKNIEPWHKSHGMTGKSATRLYSIWYGMIARCYNPRKAYFKNYGARGIRVCIEWHTFEVFEKWAYENGYSESLTLDRKNNDGDYSPENCRFISRKEQNRNKRNNKFIEFDGKCMLLSDWAKECGLPYQTLFMRLYNGWSVERTLTERIKKQ